MNDTLAVYVGYDSREDIAWQVCRQSLQRHASRPVDVHPLRQTELRDLGLYWRDQDKASTEFSITRFLTPFLSVRRRWALFVDCDFLYTGDIYAMLDEIEPGKALHVVQHDYTPANSVKMDGKQQSVYPRKNWSSCMLFDTEHEAIRVLTPQLVNEASPAHLHRFEWLDDDLIGALDLKWNFLEGEYQRPADTPTAIHYTNGGPWFEECQDVDFGDLWIAERDRYEASAKRAA